ncbi:hypothetical protein N7451_012196 [Penicillium sp. IBT 35674x]|nr:hypothetical protein N7451_012196 [Penicillium sp. IBT 35674x]
MLSGFLQSNYTRYKADTNTFATWLLETANQCGYQPPALSATISTAEIRNAKTKTTVATTKDLQNLTKVVADSGVTPPEPVLTIAKRAIKLRKAFLGQGDSTGNKRHAHFIITLEQICETLELKTNQPSKPDAKQPPPNSEAQSNGAEADRSLNKFAVFTDTAGQIQPALAEPKNVVKVTVVEEDDNENADLHLMLCNLHEISCNRWRLPDALPLRGKGMISKSLSTTSLL